MPYGIFSKGHKKKPGSTPVSQIPPTSEPPRHSGGTSGNLTVPHTTATPIVPYTPPAAPTPSRAPSRTPSTTSPGNVLSAVSDLLTPGLHLHPREVAEAAHTLGVPPKASFVATSALSSLANSAVETVAKDITKVAAPKLPPVFSGEGPQFYARAFARNSPFAKPGPYQTKLPPAEERKFRAWVRENGVPFDPNAKHVDYDMRGFWRATKGKRRQDQFFPDAWKTPFDTTFAGDSKFAKPGIPFRWEHKNQGEGVLVDERTGRIIVDHRHPAAVDRQQERLDKRWEQQQRLRSKDPLGRKTLGNASAAELVRAGKRGTLRISGRGIISTPATRQALRELTAARRAVAKIRGGNSVEAKIGEYLTHHGLSKVGAAGIIGNAYAESSLDPGAQGYGGGGLWGFTAHPNSLADLQNYAASKGRAWTDPKLQSEFLLQHVNPQTIQDVNAAKTPQQAAATFMSQFERPGIPRQEVREQAAAKALGGSWTQPADPQAVRNLAVAIKNAKANGINPTPANGDVEGGNGQFVTVRADAKGMVNWVESFVGTQEGTPRQLNWAAVFGLGSTQPWCANFVSNGLIRRGFGRGQLPANPNYVPSYEEWAQEGRYAKVVPSLAQAKPGDLVTFSGSHIGVIGKNGQMISGNYSNAVSESEVGSPSMIIRPNYRGGKVQVPVGQLPGSSGVSATASPLGETATEGTPGVGGPVGSAAAAKPQAVSFVGTNPLPVSSLLETLALSPRVGRLGEEEGEGSSNGTIARILARKRL